LALFTQNGVRFFSFQDDDFAARTPKQRNWLEEFLQALAAAGLADQVKWKISCRVDDLEPQLLELMLSHGLMAVYLGVESGSDAGLRTLNKHVSVAQNLAAIDLLKRYQVALAIGFMLFDPSSTVNTLQENFNFLEAVGADGYFPINFCKMLPYAGTPIEAQLRQAGRLKGTVTQPDYGFLDPQLDWYEFLVKRIFTPRNFSPDGNVALLQEADFIYRLASAFGMLKAKCPYGELLRRLNRQSNMLALKTLRTLLQEVLAKGIDYLMEEQETFVELAEQEWRGEMRVEVELKTLALAGFPIGGSLPNQPTVHPPLNPAAAR
jgi:anaerobic magnesium-protoporphyrin IX monomethyl ester cyclase